MEITTLKQSMSIDMELAKKFKDHIVGAYFHMPADKELTSLYAPFQKQVKVDGKEYGKSLNGFLTITHLPADTQYVPKEEWETNPIVGAAPYAYPAFEISFYENNLKNGNHSISRG